MEDEDNKQVKNQRAVALQYEPGKDRAPRVVAKGKGLIAQKIIATAEENHIPLHQDNELAQVLEALELETEIPGELFRAVAEVLAFIYRMNKKI
ncbi:MAG TPA: EscU/YscU/HrcU family type III secretion system export apparatus switch protein [Candidatus Kapabacteria bacterium]|nr:EscU/YscU/HrcU family type III secretion system export apparatus switch protein [Candidatus Kapabacteria bacterium]